MMNKRLFAMVMALMLALMAVVPTFAQDEDATNVRVLVAFTDYRLDWTRAVADAFNEQYPEYNIIIEGLASYNDVFEAAALAGDNQPAVIHYFEAATQEARDAENTNGDPLFKSVEAAIDGREEINGVPVVLGDVVGAPTTYYTLDGEFASMPWNTSSAIMFTNMSILEAAGIESIPTTWQELEAACEVIMAMDDAPEYCMTWPNHGWWVEQVMAQLGEDLANNNNGRDARATEVFLNSEGMNNYISWWGDMSDQGYYLYTGTQRDWTGTYNAFIAEQVAFLQYSSSDTTALTNDGAEAGFDVVASFLPHDGESENFGNIIGGATLWLTSGLDAEVETGALMFMNFLNNPENAADWHRVTGYIPITEASIELLEGEGWYDENPNSAVASDQLAVSAEMGGSPGALIGNFVAIRDVVTGAIEEILVNDSDVADVLDEANEDGNLLLEEYNLFFSEE